MPIYVGNRAIWSRQELLRLKDQYQKLYEQTGDKKYLKILEWINKKLGG